MTDDDARTTHGQNWPYAPLDDMPDRIDKVGNVDPLPKPTDLACPKCLAELLVDSRVRSEVLW